VLTCSAAIAAPSARQRRDRDSRRIGPTARRERRGDVRLYDLDGGQRSEKAPVSQARADRLLSPYVLPGSDVLHAIGLLGTPRTTQPFCGFRPPEPDGRVVAEETIERPPEQ
jgi:hypothetical protein